MRLIRRLTLVLFIVVAIIFVYNLYDDYSKSDDSAPVFALENEDSVIKVSVAATDEELKAGVTAYDEKDGDVTANIEIESISKFITGHQCNITYVCSDSDNHISRITRRIEFSDYTSPRFTLNRQLCLYVGEDTDITDIVGAVDCYDNQDNGGDISRNLKILSSSVTAQVAGEYTFTAQVTNSLGDTSKLQAVVTVRQRNNLEPTIELKDNIVYINEKAKFNALDYVASVASASGDKIDNGKVKVYKTSVNTDKKGYYTVIYSVKDDNDNEGYAYLTVVVE